MRKFFRKFSRPSSVAGILADFHSKLKQLEAHKVKQARKIVEHGDEIAAARRLVTEAEAEWTHAHAVLGKLQDLLGV